MFTRICWYIQAYSGIFRDNQAFSEIIKGYSGTFRSLCNLGIFRTLVYSEPWHIQNPYIFGNLIYSEYIPDPAIFRTRPIFRTLVYSEWQVYSQPSQTHREFYENNANSFFYIFSNTANSDLHETGRNNVELVSNILAYSVITRHIQEVFGDITAHSEACVTPVHSEPWYIQNPGIFKTLVYSEPWHIQKLGIFRTLVYLVPWHIQNPGIYRILACLEPEAYSEPWYIQNLKHIDNPAKHMQQSVLQI